MPVFRPGKPRLRLDRSTSYTSHSGSGEVAFDTLTYRQGDVLWPGGSSVTLPLGGLYLLTASYFLAATTQNLFRATRVELDGVLQAATGVTSTQTTGQAVSTVMDVPDGGVVTYLVTGNGVAQILGGPGLTTLTITRIGPVRWT